MKDAQKTKAQLIQELQKLRLDVSGLQHIVREKDRELSLFNRTSRALFSSLEMNEVLPILLDEVRSWFDATSASVWLVDANTRELVCYEISGPQDHIYRNWRLPPAQGIVGQVVQTGESIVISDAQKHPTHHQPLDYKTGLLLRSVLALPLRSQRDVFGAFQVADIESARFADADVALLEPTVVTVAMVIQNSRLYEQALHDADIQTHLLQEINHRVRSNLSAIVGLLYAERQRDIRDQSTYIAAINELIGRIQSIATVYNMLSVSRWQPLKLDDLIDQVAQSSLRTIPRNRHIPVHITDSAIEITSEHAHSLALVINVLLVNSIRRWMCVKGDVKIEIDIAEREDLVHLTFTEIGNSSSKKFQDTSAQTVGLELVRAVVRENLGGTVSILDDLHAPITISFKSQTSGVHYEST